MIYKALHITQYTEESKINNLGENEKLSPVGENCPEILRVLDSSDDASDRGN